MRFERLFTILSVVRLRVRRLLFALPPTLGPNPIDLIAKATSTLQPWRWRDSGKLVGDATVAPVLFSDVPNPQRMVKAASNGTNFYSAGTMSTDDGSAHKERLCLVLRHDYKTVTLQEFGSPLS
jgi:hypothetical protein